MITDEELTIEINNIANREGMLGLLRLRECTNSTLQNLIEQIGKARYQECWISHNSIHRNILKQEGLL